MVYGLCMDDFLMMYEWYMDVHLSIFLSPATHGILRVLNLSPHDQSLSFRNTQSFNTCWEQNIENTRPNDSCNWGEGVLTGRGTNVSCSSPPFPSCLGVRHLSRIKHGHRPGRSTIESLASLESWEANPTEIKHPSVSHLSPIKTTHVSHLLPIQRPFWSSDLQMMVTHIFHPAMIR